MLSRVAVLVVIVVELFGGVSSIPDSNSAVVKAESEDMTTASSMAPYSMYFSDYYMIPSDNSEKPFGGDRSDEFLYPPEKYYKQWAEEEQERDEMANNC